MSSNTYKYHYILLYFYFTNQNLKFWVQIIILYLL